VSHPDRVDDWWLLSRHGAAADDDGATVGPARDVAGGLLTFASPDRVYSTYVQLVAQLLPALLICAFQTRARRTPRTRVA
jgi:hypothetical protein